MICIVCDFSFLSGLILSFTSLKAYKDIFGKECPFLEEYQVDNGAFPEVVNGFLVHIKTLTGKTIDIMIGAENTIHELKLIASDYEGIPVDQQSLIFEGKQLEDCCSVSHYGIVSGSTIHRLLKLSGC